ncbi:hypothetical protein MAR_030079 [Mya arenaria]|uniref:Uncharacterized protein n=1 Tax=Mya arenaria TaxID=6604 RepID=A0ABY7DJ80_MYAAR|nr:hypothetical protein MAR_030079 [Mya arenaria]
MSILLHANIVVSQQGIRQKYIDAKTNHEKRAIDETIRNKLFKKYKMQGVAQKTFGVTIKRLGANRKRPSLNGKRDKVLRNMKMSVEVFLSRDDNSRIKAGKRSTKTHKMVKKQIRLLTDTMKNLHLKYLSENAEKKMSYSLFFRLRSFYIRTPKPSDRETCLCKRHDDVLYKVAKLKQLALIDETDLYDVCDIKNKDCMYRLCNTCKCKQVPIKEFYEGKIVFWHEWKTQRVERKCDDGTCKTVTVTVKQQESGSIETLVQEFQEELEKCCKHLYNIRHQ